LVQGEDERLDLVLPHPGPGLQGVVARDGAGERLPLGQDHLAAPAPQVAHPDEDDDAEQRDVEDQVPGLPEVAALGGHLVRPVVLGRADPEPPPAEGLPGRGQHPLGLGLQLHPPVLGEPGEEPRRAGRLGPDRPPVLPGPRHDAADQRDHQQQVDRGEPRGGVDVEEAEPVQPRPHGRVLVEVLPHPHRDDPALRPDRAGDRRERQQHQQHQRGPHAGQLPPAPACPPPRAEHRLPDRGVGHQITVVKVEVRRVCTHAVSCSQTPATMSTPRSTSSAPPTRWTVTCRSRSHRETRLTQPRPAATRRNGRPRPRQYATARTSPRATTLSSYGGSEADRDRMAPSTGPVQAEKPRPNTTPSSGAPASPVTGRHRGCQEPPGCQSMTRPRSTTTTPPARSSRSWWRCSARPRLLTATPMVMNTALNPATKRAAPATRRPRPGGSAPPADGMPVR